ncbi:MAG: hypothetical protein JXA73_11365 [Acidobacteria bacterium]|nr:hypothetical protein [Acidobacteriota bacterium]
MRYLLHAREVLRRYPENAQDYSAKVIQLGFSAIGYWHLLHGIWRAPIALRIDSHGFQEPKYGG